MSEKPGNESWKDVHPDFDGHLRKPLDEMTMGERAEWAWQGMQILYWARNEVRLKPREGTQSDRPEQ